MNEYQEKFIKNKLDEMSRDERFALAKELAERNRFETPLEMRNSQRVVQGQDST